jgi:two-component system invasion response regulator UvrY
MTQRGWSSDTLAALTIFLVESKKLLRDAFKALLEEAHCSVVGEAASAEMGLLEIKETNPQVLLIDIRLSNKKELSSVRQLLNDCPEMKIIIMANTVYDNFSRAFLTIKAHAYISKQINKEKLIEIINQVCRGQNVQPQFPVPMRENYFDILSNREREIMGLLTAGKNINEMAEKLKISPKTVSTYRVSLLRKLHLKNEIDLLLLMLQEGWWNKRPI